jgi:MoaA/NifB/PqqE/SkfB family radical SAM enzyme
MLDQTPRDPIAPALPRQVYIEVTNRCNSLCGSCPLTYDHFLPFEPKHHLGWEQFRQIVDQLPTIERAVLHGIGEPLLNPELPRFVAHLKARGAHVLFNTNAVLLDQRRGDLLAQAGLDELRVSMDGATRAMYRRLRGIDKFDRIIANVRAFVARRRERGAQAPQVSFWFVGMQENLHQLPDFVRLAADVGVHEAYLQRMTYFGDGVLLHDEATAHAANALYGTLEEQQAALIRRCEALADELGVVFRASGATTPGESVQAKGSAPWQGCHRPWTLTYITANGTVLPCCIAPFATTDYPQIVLGNTLERPLAQIWNDKPYIALREAVLSEDPAPWPCQHCGVRWSL